MKLPFLKHLTVLVLVFCGGFAQAQTSFVQFANNSADDELISVDVWMDTVQLIDNLSFRSASDPIEIPSSQLMDIVILDSSSVDTLSFDSMFVDSFSNGMSYLLMLEGLVDSTNYSPFVPLAFKRIELQHVPIAPSYSALLFHNGTSDADFLHIEESRRGLGILADSIFFGSSTELIAVEADDYRIKTYADSELKSELELKLLSKGLSDSSVVIASSGFINPSSNNDGPSNNWYYIPDSAGAFVRLKNSVAYLQVIHNSANPALDRLDIYAENELFRNNLNFRSKSAFTRVSSAIDILLGFSSDSSSGPGDFIIKDTFNLEAGHHYRAVLNGVSGFNFTPNKELEVTLIETGPTAENASLTDVQFIQGATDVTTLNVRETDLLNSLWIADMEYGSISEVFDLPTAYYKIRVRDLADTLDQEYQLPLYSNEFQGAAILILTSGFLDTLNNGNGAPFGVWLADSNAGPMMELSKALGNFDPATLNTKIFPNPFSSFITISAAAQPDRIELYSVDGRMIKSFSSINRITRLNLSDLAKGNYLMKLEYQNRTAAELITKQ